MLEVLSALGLLVVFVLVLLLAYFVTKWVGKRYAGGSGASSGNIRVVDKIALGTDRALYIVETAGHMLLLGVTQQHIEKLCDLDPEALLPAQEEKNSPFAATLKTVLKNNWGIGGEDKGGKKKEEEPHG